MYPNYSNWMPHNVNMNANGQRLDQYAYNEEVALKQALSESANSYAKEQKRREEEMKLRRAEMMEKVRAKEREERARRAREEREKRDPRFVACQNLEKLMTAMTWNETLARRQVGVGLQNLGNSCFLNATLQCLAYTAPLTQMLRMGNHKDLCCSKGFCTLCEIEAFVPQMLERRKRIMSPRNLFRNLGKINDLLTPGCQEDAQEFVNSLFDRMEMAYDDSYFISHNRDKAFKKDPFNPIRQVFVGTTKTTVECSKCRTVTTTEEPFSNVSLDVDPDVSLIEALSIFTQEEMMRGDEKYSCDKCKRKVIARKRLRLAKLPPTLVIHFKRFKAEAYSPHQKEFTLKKVSDRVEFPQEIDFRQDADLFIHPSHQQEVAQDSIYELYGIVVHSGPKLGYGHYYAFIKGMDGKQWFRMNDMEVMPVPLEKVLREQAYLLFYRRKTHNSLQNQMDELKVEMMLEKEKLEQAAQTPGAPGAPPDGHEAKEATEHSCDWQRQQRQQQQQRSHLPARVGQIGSTGSTRKTGMDDNVNDSYFATMCVAEPESEKSGLIEKKMESGLKGTENDIRTQYVMVPPMVTRSDVSHFDSESQDTEGSDNVDIAAHSKNAFEEVYWPHKMDE